MNGVPAWAEGLSPRRRRVVDLFRRGQRDIVATFERLDGDGSFGDHTWARPEGGGGTARVIEGGRVFERGGVNVSAVRGASVPASLARAHPGIEGAPFFATGISMVLHARNPFVPAFHANFRYFEVGSGADPEVWWFGGGADLTPAYPHADDVRHFHGTLAAWCARHEHTDYATWKAVCDDYFTVRHRGEMRGVGGVFFDELTGVEEARAGGDAIFERDIECISDGIDTLTSAYVPLVERRAATPHGERERAWQALRRGRYVEFNLVYDRGTLFGLQTGGNIEAILMSMPPIASWSFDHHPEPGTPEAAALAAFQPRDWLAGEADAAESAPNTHPQEVETR
ncbi:oxygen-dependent coproporphyrinogen oxidase [soil metagenome]|nr:oxygen-dependent coproporphyrinogen oxidase [Trueperaceae bacterium]